MLNHFKWYRRLRGGRWATVTGFMWGKRWIKLSPQSFVGPNVDYEEWS